MSELGAENGRDDTALALVVRLELKLLEPAMRADSERLDELLHADFVEYGASGRIWARQEIIDELPLEGTDAPLTAATDLTGTWIDHDTILVTYRTVSAVKNAVRSSIWTRNSIGQWQLRFHQGTPTSVR